MKKIILKGLSFLGAVERNILICEEKGFPWYVSEEKNIRGKT